MMAVFFELRWRTEESGRLRTRRFGSVLAAWAYADRLDIPSGRFALWRVVEERVTRE